MDQIRTSDRKRLIKKLGKIKRTEIEKVKSIVKEMLVDLKRGYGSGAMGSSLISHA